MEALLHCFSLLILMSICQERLADCIANGTEEFTNQGNHQRVSYEMICLWVFEVLKTVAKPKFVISRFGSVVTLNGKMTIKLYSKLRDTIPNPAVPIETILEANETLLELEEAIIDVVKELHKMLA